MPDVTEIVPASTDDPRVKPVAKQVESLAEQVDTFEVTTAEHYESGAEVLKTIKGLAKEVEDQRKKITSPLDQAKRQVMDLFRPLTESLAGAERKLKQRLVAWSSEQDRIRREEQRKAEEKARRERERLTKQAEEARQKGREDRAQTLEDRAVSTVAAPPPPAAPKVAGVQTRTVWRFRITDPAKVPDKYKIVDEKRIGGVVRALKGDTEIPGIEVWEESTMAARSA